MTAIEYLNSKKVPFVVVGYGECFIRNVDGVLEPFIKTPCSKCENLYTGKYKYNAVRLNSTYKENMSHEEYNKYIQSTFVRIGSEEKVVRVNREDCFK